MITTEVESLGCLRETNAVGSITQLIYDGDRLVAEYDNSGALLRRCVHGPGVDEPLVWYEGAGASDRRYLIADRPGSVIAENGASTTRYACGPYGEPDTWTGSRFRYTGQIMLPEVQRDGRWAQYRLDGNNMTGLGDHRNEGSAWCDCGGSVVATDRTRIE
jgi:hypothetical protein